MVENGSGFLAAFFLKSIKSSSSLQMQISTRHLQLWQAARIGELWSASGATSNLAFLDLVARFKVERRC